MDGLAAGRAIDMERRRPRRLNVRSNVFFMIVLSKTWNGRPLCGFAAVESAGANVAAVVRASLYINSASL